MKTGIDAIRVPYVAGDVTPLVQVTVNRDYATWTPLLLSATISGSPCSDDYYDHGVKACWWDSALNASGTLLRLGNSATIGSTSSWLAGINDADLVTVDTIAPGCMAHTKPGVIGTSGDNFYVFYMDTDGKLYRQSLSLVDGVLNWNGDATNGITVSIEPTYRAIIPVSTASCFIVSYRGSTLWARFYRYIDPTWYYDSAITLRSDLDLTWQDLTWCAASVHPTDANLYILTVPGGSNGSSVSVVYDFNGQTYSTPTFILATAGSEWLRRVWLSGLSGPYNGRIWGVVETSLNDNGSAQHICLVSTADGRSWRDEGFVSELEVRGKLLIDGADMVIASLCATLHATAIARISTPAPANTAILSVRDVAVTNNGIQAALTAQMTVLADDPLLEEGAAISIVVGAVVTGSVTGAAAFSGYMDSIQDQFSVGKGAYRVEARSKLSLLIGETAYQPLTTLDWKGRNVYHEDFQELGLPAVGMALSVDEGYWWPEYDSNAMSFSLRCTSSGTGLVPLFVENNHVMAKLRMVTTEAAGMVFFVTDQDKIETDRWEFGLFDSTLKIRRLVDGAATVLSSQVVTGYATGETVDMLLEIMPDHITGYLLDSGPPSGWQSVTYAGWTPGVASTLLQHSSYQLGIFASATEDSGATSTFYTFDMCDSGWPYCIQDALAMLADIAGLDTVTHTNTYNDTQLPITVRALDTTVYLTTAGDGLVMAEGTMTLRLYTTYATFQRLNGSLEYHPYNRTASISAGFRMINQNDFISIYQCGLFLCGFHATTPKYASSLNVISAGQSIELPECYDPVQTGDTAWFAWDALQPADGLLNGLLMQRRIYLLENGDGELDIHGAWPTGDILIDGSNLVGDQAYYRRTTIQLVRIIDRRNIAGMIAVTDIAGHRVFLLEPTLISRTRRTAVQDSQWAFTTADALREASLLRDDALRQAQMRELTCFWDPAIQLGDTFDFWEGSSTEGIPDCWTGIITKYQLRFERNDDGALVHECILTAERIVPTHTYGIWDQADFGDAYWG